MPAGRSFSPGCNVWLRSLAVSDFWFVLLSIVAFGVVALCAKGVEKL
jgi:hypothetical protein